MSEQWFEAGPDWFKTAVFYELHTRAFFDSSDDGMGDFRGLQQKLDYLQWLGIDCIWLLPFYPSPLLTCPLPPWRERTWLRAWHENLSRKDDLTRMHPVGSRHVSLERVYVPGTPRRPTVAC